MRLVDLEVETTEEIGEWIINRNEPRRARIEAERRIRANDLLHQCNRIGRDVEGRAARVADLTHKRSRCCGRPLLPFGGNVELKPVLDDRTAKLEAVLLHVKRRRAEVRCAEALVAE